MSDPVVRRAVMQTSLDDESEARLREVLEGSNTAAPPAG
jgi:uncharacterized membrane protein